MQKLKQLSNKELAMFCDQMAMILNAGQTPETGIELMLSDTSTDEGQQILKPILEKCNLGESFPSAIEASGVFPKYALDMIKIGNTSGKLDEVLVSLADHYNREEEIKEGIKNAVTYPFLIICMMGIVILVLIMKVLPIFNEVFNRLGTEMTGFSKGLLDLGSVLSKYAIGFSILILLFIAILVFLVKNENGQKMLRNFLADFALTKSFYDKIAAGRFASSMSLMKAAGLDTDSSLELAKEVVDNKRMAKKIEQCKALMNGDDNTPGISFSQSLSKCNIFSHVYSKMINIGFKSGSVDKVFKKIADGYNTEINTAMTNLISVLEPTLVIVLSVIVGLILLSVIMPLMGIMTSIG